MKADLNAVKEILRRFLTELEMVEKLLNEIKGPMPATAFTIQDRMPVFDLDQFPPDSSEQDLEEDAYKWLHFEAWHPRALMHRPKPNPLPDYYHQPAIHLYLEWLDLDRNIIDRGEIIPRPGESCSLIDYLRELEYKITDECEDRAVWIRSLKSFLQYIREDVPDKTMLGGVNTIFPNDMIIQDNHVFERTEKGIEKIRRQVILRYVLPAVYPIDIQMAAKIIKSLFNNVFVGRSNSQRSIAEALGFAWVCHAVASAHVMTEENELFNLKITDLVAPPSGAEKNWFFPEYFLRVPSINGPVEVPISKAFHDYLLRLPRKEANENIFSLPWRTVYRTFLNKGVLPTCGSDNSKFANLTFLTFMSQPHHGIGHRYAPSNKTA